MKKKKICIISSGQVQRLISEKETETQKIDGDGKIETREYEVFVFRVDFSLFLHLRAGKSADRILCDGTFFECTNPVQYDLASDGGMKTRKAKGLPEIIGAAELMTSEKIVEFIFS